MSTPTVEGGIPALDRSIDDVRPIKVICIGAGISGILAGIRLPQKIKNLDLMIYEKNEDIGGTWFENRYPGISSDIPSHAYQYTFADNPHWGHFYATGSEMYNYLKEVAERYDVQQYVKLRHVFKGANWLENEGKWEVEILRLEDNHTITETADIVLKATGLLNTWKWPKVPGLHDFNGRLLHSANYDTKFDAKGKTIAVIGNGSTGIQLVPALQPIASRIINYTRSKSWVSPRGPYSAEIEKRGGNENFTYTEEEQQEFARNPEECRKYRKELENTFLKLHLSLFRDSEAQKQGSNMVENLVKEKLKRRPDIFKTIRPEYPVGCKRLGAGPGYLEALCEDNVELVTCGIKQVLEDGIIDTAGVFRAVDAIICATGFDNSLDNSAAPIIGQGGISLDDIWTPEPEAYLGLCAVRTPNMFFLLGPGGAPTASMIPMAEFQMNYVVKAIQKLQREHIKSMVVSVRAKNGFVKVADAYFARTVLTQDCASWYKSKGRPDGRIQALWPGALGHGRYSLENPRWEDFEYELMEDLEDNPMAWMGNGTTLALVRGEYLTDHLDNVDIPPILKKPQVSRLQIDPADLKLPLQ